MLWLSEVMLKHHDIESFTDLERVIAEQARQGAIFFRMDVKPPYADTPEDWEDRLESAFNSR